MHELSLCEAIADIARRGADGRRVDSVHVRVGQLRQVVPDALTFCWTMVTSETDLDGSSLQLEAIDAVLNCRACGHEFAMGTTYTMACSNCHGYDVEVVTGEELLVTALELDRV